MGFINISVFVITITAALTFDFHKHKIEKDISLKESVYWVIFYVFISLLFSIFIYFRMGIDYSLLFLTGWGLEKVLAVDNLVVFSAIFAYFGIKDKYQHKILYFGIIGAIILRLIFVSIGVGLSHVLGYVSDIIFASIILYTAWLMHSSSAGDDVDYENTWYIRYTKKWLNVTTENKDGKFFINGNATVYVFALIAIEFSDIIFAFDSVPAIISVTKEPFLIYSSMMFAILGLRSMYFVLSALTRNLEYFETSVIFVLIFISGKLFLKAFFDFTLSPGISLVYVLTILSFGVIFSKIKKIHYEL